MAYDNDGRSAGAGIACIFLWNQCAEKTFIDRTEAEGYYISMEMSRYELILPLFDIKGQERRFFEAKGLSEMTEACQQIGTEIVNRMKKH